MLTIRCGGEPTEIELSATPAEFERLSASITDFAASDAVEIAIQAVVAAPGPYDRSLASLRIGRAAGPLLVSVAGTSLRITGNSAALSLFAQCLPVESELPPGYHIHFETFGREWAVSPDSLPLVLLVACDPAA